jgi:4'-phosphopantetheinyl transferase
MPASEFRLSMPRRECCDVALWYCNTDSIGDADLASWGALLSDEERARRDRFVFAEDKRDFTAAHALVRRALSRYDAIGPAEWRFETNGFGKPDVVAEQAGEPPLAFSLSHTRGLVACAIMRGASVGIDVERCGRGVADGEIASRYFAESEIRHLQTCPPEQYPTRFIEFWVLKESYIKAVGSGLSLDLHSFSFEFLGDSNLRFTPHDGGSGWQFWLMALPASRLAIAVRPRARARASPRCALRLAFHDAGVANEIRHPTLVRWSDSFDAAAR